MKGFALLATCLLALALVTGVTTAAPGGDAMHEPAHSPAVDLGDREHGHAHLGGADVLEGHKEETPTPTHTSDAEDGSQSDSSSDEGDGSDEQTVVKQVDEDLVVADVDWNRSGGDLATVTVTLRNREGGGGSQVTLTEGITREAAENSDRFGIKSVEVPDGETVDVQLTLYTSDPIGVMVVSSASREAGHGSFLSAPKASVGILKGNATWTDVRAGVFFGSIMALVFALLGAWHLVASRNTDLQEADLEPDARRWES